MSTDTPIYTLATLNTLRAKNNMPPLKAWKESKAKLEAAISKLAAKAPLKEQLEVSAKPVKTPKDKPAKKATKSTVTKKAKSEISISTIAEECNMDPKVARAKMRRKFGLKEEGKWPTSMAEIKKVLDTDARKKAE